METQSHEMQKLDETIEELQTKLLIATQQLEQHEGERKVQNERRKHFSENKQKLLKQKESAENRLEKLQQELIEETKRLNDIEEIRQNKNDSIKH